MQPSATLYSGVCEDKSVLKFCSKECKGLWFPTPGQKSLYVATHIDETSQLHEEIAPTMTIIIRKGNGVEQIYLSVDETSGRPFIVWHIREVEHQSFTHFYILADCLPLNSVWPKQYSSYQSEFMGNYIATKRLEVQSHIQIQLNQAAIECGLEDFKAFLKQVMTSSEVSLYQGKL